MIHFLSEQDRKHEPAIMKMLNEIENMNRQLSTF